MEGLMAARSRLGLALIASAAIGTALAGCAETMSLAELPAGARLPEKLLTKEEQAEAVNTMAEKAQTQQAVAAKEQAEAAKAIEKTSKTE
jgi:hypothetical protein